MIPSSSKCVFRDNFFALSGFFIQLIVSYFCCSSILDDDRETEMENNLNHVSNIVGELRTMATDMNQEIRIHNKKLDDIAAKVSSLFKFLSVVEYFVIVRPLFMPCRLRTTK